MGSFKTVGDKQHIEIVRLYAGEGKGYNVIAEEIGRSSRSPTVTLRSIMMLCGEVVSVLSVVELGRITLMKLLRDGRKNF